MANEVLGIVEERIRDRKLWGGYEYKAPELPEARVDVAKVKREIEAIVRASVEEVLNSAGMEKAIQGMLEKSLRRSIAESEEMTKWRERQLQKINTEGRPEIDEIVQTVCEVTGVSSDELLHSPRRLRNQAWPRQLAYWLVARLRPDLSLPRIGHILGGRDHTTVMHGRANVERRRDQDPFKGWLADPRIADLFDGECP